VEAWDADVVTADGGTVHVRPIGPDDAERLVAFHSRQSAESIYFRFFSPRPQLSDAEVEHLTHVDGHDRMAFIALLGDELVGVARYDRMAGRPDAEVAFFIDEEHKGRGLGTILLEYLAAAARDVGITAFTAMVLPSNRRMIKVFQQAGFDASSRFEGGVIEVHLDLEPTEEAQAAMEARARAAEARSVARLLEPASIAVIGAGRESGGLGHELFLQLLHNRFAGPVYPVNPYAEHVGGVRARPTVLDIADRVDLAIIAVPSSAVREVVEQCAVARVG
jgi:RimJ/RimL family protein N-acetyltransferase/predicted CoA-binding protein